MFQVGTWGGQSDLKQGPCFTSGHAHWCVLNWYQICDHTNCGWHDTCHGCSTNDNKWFSGGILTWGFTCHWEPSLTNEWNVMHKSEREKSVTALKMWLKQHPKQSQLCTEHLQAVSVRGYRLTLPIWNNISTEQSLSRKALLSHFHNFFDNNWISFLLMCLCTIRETECNFKIWLCSLCHLISCEIISPSTSTTDLR